MNTRRVKLIALLWWVLPGSLLATGIGDMTVTSYINQPLQANIALLQPDGLLESEVIASLASPDDLLQTVLSSGDEAQREHAQSLLDSLE